MKPQGIKNLGFGILVAAWVALGAFGLSRCSVALANSQTPSTQQPAFEPAESGFHTCHLLLLIAAAALPFVAFIASSRTSQRPERRSSAEALSEIVQTLEIIVWVADARTLETFFISQGAEEILGYPVEPWLGESDFLFVHIHPDDREPTLAYIRKCAAEGRDCRVEYRAITADGRTVWLRNLIRVVADAAGRPVRLRGVMVDITDHKQREESPPQRHLLKAVLDYIPARIAYLDRSFHIVYANLPYAQACGRAVDEVIGCSCFELFSNPDLLALFEHVRDSGEPYTAQAHLLMSAVRDESEAAYWNWHLHPLRSPENYTSGLVLSLADVTHLESARREGERAVEHLRQAEAAKDRFLAMVSHELRNPLSPILSGLDVLRRALPADSRARRSLEVIERSARLQARLVNDLLDLSAITWGKFQLQQIAMTLDTVALAAAEVHRSDFERASLAFHTEVLPGLWVRGDPDRLQQAVINLLSNAIKFTPPGGEVRLTVLQAPARESEDGEAGAPDSGHIVVEDTGIGISGDLLPRIFEMFLQGQTASESGSGLGIGLALVRSIIEMHGGRVWAESEGLGKGSRFTIEIPLIPPPP